ncbi:Polyamine aminopropyltransferase [Emticicia aquatica]|uniref:Polyamine aminopropyltransferase n=1 Tax=Emticicia aquatica TaxID=1681835 RepID=A0ABN8EP00_9BACT|nr:polyamine aminopropyltransferase [Emticicia aquatica]CAH0994617.1 Polyamine aminopropyltransferase [Emticicia aquatica]
MDKNATKIPFLLLFSVFLVATCGLIYELIAGTLASYLMGDSISQFSIIIGLYLFSMGIGSFCSKYFDENLLDWFIQIELLVGLVGGITSSILFIIFNSVESFQWILYGLISLTGIFVGLEIPLLMQILNQSNFGFKDIISKVFTFDYVGALLASILFPLVFMPKMGLIRTSFFFGILNTLVALLVLYHYSKELKYRTTLWLQAFFVFILLTLGFIFSDKILSWAEASTYDEKIIFAKTSPYQRIVLTRQDNNIKLFLNRNLQFSSFDEYRYHEALIHPLMTFTKNPEKILVLGGGDGMAVRELLKYTSIKSITLIDLDADMTNLFRKNEMLTRLNQNALNNIKVKVLNQDAFLWIKQNKILFDAIVIDFPDPNNFALGKLYSNTFYRELTHTLAPEGFIVVQSTSPFMAPKSYWCVNKTLQSVGFKTLPYHVYVPSFGDWGYVLASKQAFISRNVFQRNLRFMNDETFKQSQFFPKDMAQRATEINKLNNQILVQYFEEEWAKVM